MVSGVGFAAHIAYGHFRPGELASHDRVASQQRRRLGAGAVAVAANVPGWMAGSSYRPSIVIARGDSSPQFQHLL
jgi:hypothetical protein